MKKVDIDKRELDMTIVMMAFDSYSDNLRLIVDIKQ